MISVFAFLGIPEIAKNGFLTPNLVKQRIRPYTVTTGFGE